MADTETKWRTVPAESGTARLQQAVGAVVVARDPDGDLPAVAEDRDAQAEPRGDRDVRDHLDQLEFFVKSPTLLVQAALPAQAARRSRCQ